MLKTELVVALNGDMRDTLELEFLKSFIISVAIFARPFISQKSRLAILTGSLDEPLMQ